MSIITKWFSTKKVLPTYEDGYRDGANAAYEKGFNDGIDWEDKADAAEIDIEEWIIEQELAKLHDLREIK